MNIGIEEADNGGDQRERDKMESLEVERQTLEWSGVELCLGAVRTIFPPLSYSST